jgi:hypothetical protein
VFSYNNTTRAALTFLDCETVGHDSLLRESPSVSCHSDKYARLRPLFVVLLCVVVVGLPLFFLVLLRCSRVPDGDDKGGRVRRERYGILFEMFKPPYWCVLCQGARTPHHRDSSHRRCRLRPASRRFYEPFNLARRAFIIALVSFLPDGDAMVAVIWLLTAYLLLHIYIQVPRRAHGQRRAALCFTVAL